MNSVHKHLKPTKLTHEITSDQVDKFEIKFPLDYEKLKKDIKKFKKPDSTWSTVLFLEYVGTSDNNSSEHITNEQSYMSAKREILKKKLLQLMKPAKDSVDLALPVLDEIVKEINFIKYDSDNWPCFIDTFNKKLFSPILSPKVDAEYYYYMVNGKNIEYPQEEHFE